MICIGRGRGSNLVTKIQEYCNGFMICPQTKQILVIRKNRPLFQAGKLNGIGGKIEKSETPLAAMVREFREESGIWTTVKDWEPTVILRGSDFVVHFFRTLVQKFPVYRSITDEQVSVVAYEHLMIPGVALENMQWILPLQFSAGVRFPLMVEWVHPH